MRSAGWMVRNNQYLSLSATLPFFLFWLKCLHWTYFVLMVLFARFWTNFLILFVCYHVGYKLPRNTCPRLQSKSEWISTLSNRLRDASRSSVISPLQSALLWSRKSWNTSNVTWLWTMAHQMSELIGTLTRTCKSNWACTRSNWPLRCSKRGAHLSRKSSDQRTTTRTFSS